VTASTDEPVAVPGAIASTSADSFDTRAVCSIATAALPAATGRVAAIGRFDRAVVTAIDAVFVTVFVSRASFGFDRANF